MPFADCGLRCRYPRLRSRTQADPLDSGFVGRCVSPSSTISPQSLCSRDTKAAIDTQSDPAGILKSYLLPTLFSCRFSRPVAPRQVHEMVNDVVLRVKTATPPPPDFTNPKVQEKMFEERNAPEGLYWTPYVWNELHKSRRARGRLQLLFK